MWGRGFVKGRTSIHRQKDLRGFHFFYARGALRKETFLLADFQQLRQA